MKKIILTACTLLTLLSCNKDPDEDLSGGYPHAIGTTFLFEVPGMSATRSLTPQQEEAVGDLNLYVFSAHDGTCVEHSYLTSVQPFTLSLAPGDYELYAVANAKSDLGEMDAAALGNFSWEALSESDLTAGGRLPMSARQKFRVGGASTVRVELQRCTAKLSLELSVADAFGDFTLRSVQVTGVPKSVTPFAAGKPTAAGQVTAYEKIPLSGRNHTVTFYLPENAQGKVSGITDPRQRSPQNAPAQATCLHIEGETSAGKVDYYVYPGGNTTDDFDILRNRHYRLRTTISGTSSADTRLSTLEMELTPLPASSTLNVEQTSSLTLRSTDPQGYYFIRYTQLSGSGTLSCDGMGFTPGGTSPFMRGATSRTARIGYTPRQTGLSEAAITVYDSYGYSLTRTLSTTASPPEIKTSTSFPASFTAHSSTPLELGVTRENYEGGFTVSYTTTGRDCRLYYNGKALQQNTPIELNQGNTLFHLRSAYPGKIAVTFTIRCGDGASKTVTVESQCVPMQVEVTFTLSIRNTLRTITQGSYSGTQADPTELILELHTDRALPGEISFLCKTSYTLGYYSSTTQKRETPSEQEKKLTLPVGSTDARVAVDSRSGYCMGRSSSSRRLLIPGYYFLSEYDRTTGTSHVAGDVTVSKVTASGLPEGSFEVSYSVVLK